MNHICMVLRTSRVCINSEVGEGSPVLILMASITEYDHKKYTTYVGFVDNTIMDLLLSSTIWSSPAEPERYSSAVSILQRPR